MHRSRNPTDVQFKNAQNGFFFTEFDQIYTTAGGELPLTPLLTALVQLLGLERCFVSQGGPLQPGGLKAPESVEREQQCIIIFALSFLFYIGKEINALMIYIMRIKRNS